MAYRLRVYAPTGLGVTYVYAYSPSAQLASAVPAGTSTPCIDLSGITSEITLYFATEDNTTTLSNWKVNCDNAITYQYTDSCTVAYSSAYSNVYVLLSVNQAAATTYYATLSFDANGGSGAPATQYGSSADGSGYIQFTIPSTTPTRSGYTFSGWATNTSGSGTIRYPGGTYTGYGSTSYPGPSHILYAVWTQASYEVTIVYDANGGSGAPASQTVTGTSSSVSVTLSSVIPSRSGYTFLGWSTSSTATSATYSAGQYLSTVYAGSSGYTWTLYAVWGEDTTGTVWVYYNGVWKRGTPYVFYNGVWKKATPYVFYNGVWKTAST